MAGINSEAASLVSEDSFRENEENFDENAGIENLPEIFENNDGIPYIGQMFESEEHAYTFYLDYSAKKGFGIKRRQISRDTDNTIIYTRGFTCTKEGYKGKDKRDQGVRKPRAETRTGCEAQFAIKRVNKAGPFMGKYKAYKFVEEHNHELLKPHLVHMLPCQRKITEAHAHQIEVAEQSGIPIRQAHEQMGRHAGGREPLGFTRIDHKNHLRNLRQKSMGKGEPSILVDYFEMQRENNPHFFSQMQLDSEDQITNVFWADAQMIIDYSKFGDFVSFDTTYKVNNKHRPLGIFVGYNHYKETAIFGVALMYDETAPSFEWLFQTFLDCMGNKAPKTIFTDQDAAMAKAIKSVLSGTSHRLCVWHLKQNALKHVSHIFQCVDGIQTALGAFFEEIEDDDEFHTKWNKMLKDYKCEDNLWLKRTFDIREKWGYPYVRHTFSVEKRSTQLSESFNSCLKNYIQSDHNLSQFFCHFDRVLKDKRYKETEADYSKVQKLPRQKVSADMLTQAGDVYTTFAFETFQDQFEAAIETIILYNQTLKDVNGDIIYTVEAHKKSKLNKGKLKRLVRVTDQSRVSCSCMFWEQMGILCSHCIKVLKDILYLTFIPDDYVLKRWTKNAKVEVVTDLRGSDIQADPHLEQTEEFRTINVMFRVISCRCIERPETISYVKKASKEMLENVNKMLQALIDGVSNDDGGKDAENLVPKGFKTKGRSNQGKRRAIGPIEKSLAKQDKKRKRQEKKQQAAAQPCQKNVKDIPIGSVEKKMGLRNDQSSQPIQQGFVALLQQSEYPPQDSLE